MRKIKLKTNSIYNIFLEYLNWMNECETPNQKTNKPLIKLNDGKYFWKKSKLVVFFIELVEMCVYHRLIWIGNLEWIHVNVCE